MIIEGPKAEISATFGVTPGAILKLSTSKEPATLVFPELALPGPYNVTWRIERRGKFTKPKIGKVCSLLLQIPEGKPDPQIVESRGKPFEIRWPTGGKDTINLAIGEISQGKRHQQKVTWTVVAPRHVDKGFGVAYFDLTRLSHAYFHATTKKPTAPEQPATK